MVVISGLSKVEIAGTASRKAIVVLLDSAFAESGDLLYR